MSDRKPVIISEEQLEEQRQYIQQIRLMPDAPKSYHVVTYGCQMNAHDSEILAGMLRDMGMEEAADRESADFVLFNTCCVRDNAERRALGNVTWLKEVRKKNPRLMIGVCGCMIQQPGMAEKILKQYRFVDLAFGTANLYRLPELMLKALESDHAVVEVEEQDTIAEGLPVQRLRHDAAYITIMYGCDNYCTYCIVPYVRGRERSRHPDEIEREARELVAAGYKDITLLGQNVDSYGRDLDEDVDFADLIRRLNAIPGDFVIRFMSSHPKDATEKLFRAMAECEKCAHQMHLPVQSGNDRVLHAMNRGYTREKYLAQVALARQYMPDLVLTTDIIVGFPGETDAEFDDTLSLIETVRYDAMFTFIYSPRVGTPAAKMPDPYTRAQKQVRFDALIASANAISEQKHRAYEGSVQRVLVDGADGRGDHPLTARTKGGRLVHMRGDEVLVGQFVDVKITGSNTWALYGEEA